MKKLISACSFVLFIAILLGCSPSTYIVSEYGNEANLEFVNGVKLNCEIIYFSDSSIVFSPIGKTHSGISLLPKTLSYINYNNLKSISILGFDGKNWGTGVILFQVIPVGLLAAAAASVETNPLPVILIFGFPAIITSLFLSASDGETPEWHRENPVHNISDLKIYSRYPNGLNNVEVKNLLVQLKQKKIKKFIINK